jgi:hypothetical protein
MPQSVCEFTRTFSGLSGQSVGHESRYTANWHPEMGGSPDAKCAPSRRTRALQAHTSTAICAVQLGATMMSSFLVNAALILLAATAVVQFCATAFDIYAKQTAIQEVFGSEIFHLQSVRPLFKNNVFVYIFLVFVALSALWIIVKGPTRRRKRPMTLEEVYASG